ncbi:sodium-driven chloride bicarbonate exchanger-like [Coregonus clupeaformis]|uniref:sodium-driven chloride bicarbonate exchanger-like n=1 Tax=Coregonus clupeaformis TaxID=59861 RepID=UPI001E1C767B|nr:sodium-driven chloride bicarbonate exchanger-like [Coregonus clupeaformis]
MEKGEGEHVLQTGNDEAVVDLGKTSSTIHTNFEKEELESHRAVYVGVHVPLGRETKRRHHRHRGNRHHRKRRDRSDREDGRESPSYDTPSQRVQFILGTEDDDEEHMPHDLFTELDELFFRDGHVYEWRETARWLKFEEDVEDGGERWSKPYVATLSLHSLFELRSCILNGTVMLDMRANTIEEIADMVIDSMVASAQLEEGLRQKVREAMLKRHHHQNEKKLSNRIPLVRSFADIGKKQSDPHLLERNGSLSAYCPSLLRHTSTTPPSSRESRGSQFLNHLSRLLLRASTHSSPLSTPQDTPPLARHRAFTPPCPSSTLPCSSSTPPLTDPDLDPEIGLASGEGKNWSIPSVVVHAPDGEELKLQSCLVNDHKEESEGADPAHLVQLLTPPPAGLLASPQSAPGNLENSKPSESRINGGSRENSTVDFSKTCHCSCGSRGGGARRPAVDMNFMKKIPPGAEASNVLVGEVEFLERPIIAFIRLSPAVLLTGLTEVPVPTRFLFLLLGPFGKGPQYHEIGRSIATLMTDEIFHDVAYKAKDRNDLLSGIDEFLDQVTVLPPGEWDPTIRIEPPKSVPSQEKRKMPSVPNGSAHNESFKEDQHQAGPELQRTGRIFGGLVMDVRRKAPFLWRDIRDALSLQCLASVLFLYCACMSPVITFGGLLGEATKGNISAIESLFGASLTGVAFSMFAGQPLTILGSTGPVLVFEKILFKFCSDYDLSYLSLRTSIGLWTAFLCLVLVATDASSLVCYITRFTEEAFAALICIIFIYEALEKLVHLGELYPINMNNELNNLTFYTCQCSPPVNATPEIQQVWNHSQVAPESISWTQLDVTECSRLRGELVGPACSHHGPYIPDVLFWSVILFFTTFFLSSFLKQFKTKLYFPTKVRSTISDFAVFLTIMILVLVDYLVGIPSPKLSVPDRFEPTSKNRGWLISPLGTNPWWTMLAAAIPALLCTILIFMDQQITAVIINRKEHKLKKGCGYHLDLLVVSVMLGVCSIMGLPWFVAATVLSISHVNSLKLESECSAPGEQPKFLGIREQRVTSFMIFILMGCSVFMTSVLKLIPMPVLYGVFLYMGVSSLKGIQFFDRIKLFCMPAKHQPDLIYLRYVPLWKVHVFTLVQLTCLVLLWVIKASAAAVVFPMMVLALVFIRKLLDFCFTNRELSWLDDLMPESKKKKEDDKKKKAKEEAQRMLDVEEGIAHPYDGPGVLKTLKVSLDPSMVNISDEMAKTANWKSVSMNSDSAKALKHSASQAKVSCVKINLENDQGEMYGDAETSL